MRRTGGRRRRRRRARRSRRARRTRRWPGRSARPASRAGSRRPGRRARSARRRVWRGSSARPGPAAAAVGEPAGAAIRSPGRENDSITRAAAAVVTGPPHGAVPGRPQGAGSPGHTLSGSPGLAGRSAGAGQGWRRNGLCRSVDMNPHRSQAFILDVSRGAGIGRVHDRHIISPRQVHDRLYQIQSLRGDPGNPCDMMRPLVQSPDRAQCRSTRHRASLPTRLRAARTRSPPRCSLDRTARADPAARAGRGCEPDQPAAQREQNGEETGRPGCVAYTSQTSRLGARITGQNGRGSAKQAVPRTAPSARTLSAICP